MTEKIYLNQPLVVELDCGVNVIANTPPLYIDALKPDGSKLRWNAASTGATTIAYSIPANVLSLPGTWRLQSVIGFTGGDIRGDTVEISVFLPFR